MAVRPVAARRAPCAQLFVAAAILASACSGAPSPPTEPSVRSVADHGAVAAPGAEPASEPNPLAPPSGPSLEGAELADAIGGALARLCPPQGLPDPAARERCAEALTRDPTLSASMRRPQLLWGAQSPNAGFDLGASNTNLFDSLVWRRLYLSTFAFPGGHRVEQDGARFIVHVPVVFRNALDAGEYPYPFWHSQAKWQSYERTEELLFFVNRASVTAVLRSEKQDATRAHVDREWDGQWTWHSARGEEPRVALYKFLFSADNPHVAALEAAFRAFSEKQRAAACTSCHNPGNPAKINPLEFFNYPNQALTSRHHVVEVLVNNGMPPRHENSGLGIADARYRNELLRLAQDFAALGDRALAYEKTRVPE